MVSRSVTPLRRAHVIAPFGPGALLLTRDRVSAVVCAPATWLKSLPKRPSGSVPVLDELTINDTNLQAATGVARFVMPWPSGSNPKKDRDWLLPAARFPLVEACSNPKCFRLIYRSPADASPGRCNACTPPSSKRRSWPTFQTALVLACPAGHLDDIDWVGWLHALPGSSCRAPDVRYRVSDVADRPYLNCESCSRSAQFDPNTTFRCTGARPWLPHSEPETCTHCARPLERTSTAAYYAWQLSSLTIPLADADNPALLHALTENATLRTLSRLTRRTEVIEKIVETAERLGIHTDAAEVTRHLKAIQSGRVSVPRHVQELRTRELNALLSSDHPRRI